jgi:hypothetical protein
MQQLTDKQLVSQRGQGRIVRLVVDSERNVAVVEIIFG